MLNISIIMGRLTADPELRATANGTSVCTFTVAVERDYTPKGSKRQTDFITVVAWRQTAEFVCKYFAKGSMIAVHGALQTRKYEDSNGNKRTAVEIVASGVSFTGEKRDTQPVITPALTREPQPATSFAAATPASAPDVSVDGFIEIPADDDLPF